MADPSVSVVIRSRDRGAALCELVAAALRQRDVRFEVVVVEQSQRMAAVDRARLAELALDPRVRVLERPPLGGPAARNVGARAARGDILVFMDDDDLPDGDRWLAHHLANFVDPMCLGANGAQFDPGARVPPYRNMARARRNVCKLVPILMWQQTYTMVDRRCAIESLVGANMAIRRSVLARVGLWDECTPCEDEQSFNYRLRRARRAGEYLVFDPVPRIIRRRDIPGGMGKRDAGIVGIGARMFEFQHRIIAHYFPLRFIALYPIYMALLYIICCDWIWNDLHDQGGTARRIARTLGVFVAFPALWLVWMTRLVRKRLRQGPARRGIERAPLLGVERDRAPTAPLLTTPRAQAD